MSATEPILDRVRAALRSEPRLDLHRFPVRLGFADGVLTLEGEAANVAAKKLALERAAAVGGVVGIVDRLRVRPAQAMGDGEIRDRVRDALIAESALAEVAIREWVKGGLRTAREPSAAAGGEIRIRVEDGVVTLDGDILSLAHKRLAGVLAWWVPGVRDVINGLGVSAPEPESEAEITDSVRAALEKDPFVAASQVRVVTRGSTVLLEGLVPTEAEREMAEFDAWYVFGVDRVVNRIQVRR
ncbi:MAG: BON domain-containing protein [Proteobacteria bacterium]|nr:BON domain-containing protein [Pseudomonadota bacterium]